MRIFLIAVLVIGVSGLIGCAKKSAVEVVAVVNGQEITMAMVDSKIENLPTHYQAFATQHKKEVVDEMVIEELLFKEAKKRKLHKDSEVKALIDEAIRKVLIAKVIEDEAKKSIPVSEDDVKTYFEQNKDRYLVPEMVRASHILTSTEEEAKKAKEELDAGVDFAEVARKYSKDLTKDRGGDLGYFKKGQMIPEFEKTAFALEIGQISDLVKSRFGYHIIKLGDRKPATYRQFEEVKSNIRNLLSRNNQREAFDEFANKLKAKAYIEVKEELLVAPEAEETKEVPAELPVEPAPAN